MTAPTLPQLPQTEMRHGDVGQLLDLLELHKAHKVDVVMPLDKLRSELGLFELSDIPAQLLDDGVLDISGTYRLSDQADKQLAQILDIPIKYYRKTREQAPLLFDDNFNHWATHTTRVEKNVETTPRVLVRTMYGSHPDWPGMNGQVRAVLSDKYGMRDNYDTAIALIDGMRLAGLQADNVIDSRLSENRMYLYVSAPEISVLAEELFAGYVSPYSGQGAGDLPIVEAGLVCTNSETGWGATVVRPRLRARICSNGMTMTRMGQGFRKVHLGAKLGEGQVMINQSGDTIDAANRLITNQMRDAIRDWLTPEFVQSQVDALTEHATTELTNPTETVEVISKELGYTQDEKKMIMADFFRSRQQTSGAIMHAVTSAAQRIDNVDRAQTFEETGIDAMMLAARHQASLVDA